jgi:DHA1 family tetracycline resistance protein-like MFS transporter
MTAQSKEEVDDKATKKLTSVIGSAFALQVIQSTLIMTVNSSMMLNACRGDASAAARMTGNINTVGALLEFLSGPLLGRLSDKYGRKPFVVLGTLGTVLMDFLVYLNPTSISALMAKISISTMTNTACITSVRAALSDKLSGKDLGVANAKVGIYAGLAVVVGPLLGTLSQARIGNANVYLIAALVGCLNALNLSSRFDESLAVENRKDMDWSAANPTSFTKLLTCGREAAMCSYSLVPCVLTA